MSGQRKRRRPVGKPKASNEWLKAFLIGVLSSLTATLIVEIIKLMIAT